MIGQGSDRGLVCGMGESWRERLEISSLICFVQKTKETSCTGCRVDRHAVADTEKMLLLSLIRMF